MSIIDSKRLLALMLLMAGLMTVVIRAEDETVDDDEDVKEEETPAQADYNLSNEEDLPPGTSKMSFKPPQLTEEQEKLNWMPDEMKCDGCLAVSYQIHATFARGHLHHEDNKEWRLHEGDVIDKIGEPSFLLSFYSILILWILFSFPLFG